ncbi:unnamed protein product [Heterobilharzia americana]|nr:unnamed protein product [Heterobilharzia americana]
MDENHTDRGDKIQTNCSSSSPVSQDMNKSNFQAKFSKVLVQLSLILTNIQVIYVCHKKHLSLKLSTPIYSSSSSSSSTNFNLLSDESCQKYISRFKSLTSALSHWHAREHQKSIIKQQICAEHDNSQTQQQHNKSSESIHQSDETFDVCWQLGDAEGTIEELPTTITKLLTPLIDYSMNKFSIQHNILMNGCTTDNPESVNLIHCNDGDTSSSNAKSILSIDNDDRDHDMQPTKVEMPEVIPNQHSKFKNENQHYPTFDELKQQLNNEELKLSINQNNGQSNGIQRVSQLFKFTTNPPSSNITPATDISEGVHMPIVSNITTSTWNVYNIGEPLEEVGQKYDMKISIEVERCHSENNKLSVEQRLPENWLDIGKPKSKTLNESDTLTTMVTAATANSIVSDWPTRPKSEPILKLTNQFTTESEIDTNKTNIHKVKALQNLTDPTKITKK